MCSLDHGYRPRDNRVHRSPPAISYLWRSPLLPAAQLQPEIISCTGFRLFGLWISPFHIRHYIPSCIVSFFSGIVTLLMVYLEPGQPDFFATVNEKVTEGKSKLTREGAS